MVYIQLNITLSIFISLLKMGLHDTGSPSNMPSSYIHGRVLDFLKLIL